MAPRHGAPKFDTTDVFLLDGEDLVRRRSLGVVSLVVMAATGPGGFALAAASGALYLYGKETGNKDAMMIGEMLLEFQAGWASSGSVVMGLFEAATCDSSPLDPQMKEDVRIAFAGYLWISGQATADFSKWNDGLLSVRQTKSGDLVLGYSFPIAVTGTDSRNSAANQSFQFRGSVRIHDCFGSSGSSHVPGVQMQDGWHSIVNASTSSTAVPPGGAGHLSFASGRLSSAHGGLDGGGGGLADPDGGSYLSALCFNGMVGTAGSSPLATYAMGSSTGTSQWSGEFQQFQISQN